MTDDDKNEAAKELMWRNGRLAALMSDIADLEAKRELDSSEQRRLDELKLEESNLSDQIHELEARL